MQKLRDYFQQIGFANETLDPIVSAFKLQSFEKDDLVVAEGKISRHIGFVESGLFQYYVVRMVKRSRATSVLKTRGWLR